MFKLIAGAGYLGTLFGMICVGMKARDAFVADPRLYYDEEEDLIQCRLQLGGAQILPGLALNVPGYEPQPETVPELPIEAISVHLNDLHTFEVMTG